MNDNITRKCMRWRYWKHPNNYKWKIWQLNIFSKQCHHQNDSRKIKLDHGETQSWSKDQRKGMIKLGTSKFVKKIWTNHILTEGLIRRRNSVLMGAITLHVDFICIKFWCYLMTYRFLTSYVSGSRNIFSLNSLILFNKLFCVWI
jgi:hypothetical protein